MRLFLHVDASYLSRSYASSVVDGYFFLGNANKPLQINGATHVFSSIIPCIVSSAGASEAEYAALFGGAQHAASLRTILHDLGYPQPPTIIMCDNTCAIGIATDSILYQAKTLKGNRHAIPCIGFAIAYAKVNLLYLTSNRRITLQTTSPRTSILSGINSSCGS